MKARLLALGACLMLAGCATYQAKPVEIAAYPAALAARQLPTRASPWTQSDLLPVALANNADVVQARAKYATALAAAKVARQAPPMTLTLTAEYSKQAGGSSPWLYGVGSSIPLDIGAQRSSRLTSADLTALQALYDYGEAVWAARMALARAVADAARIDEEQGLARRAVDLRQDRLNRLTARVAAGEDDRPFALLAQSELLAAQRRLADVMARQAQSRAALGKALGLSTAAVSGMQIAPPQPAQTPESAWRDQAALSRRDVLRAVADYDLAEAALRLEIARQYPSLSIGPGYTWERGVTKLPFNLGLTLPPYDLNRANIAQAEAKRSEAGAALEAVQASVLAAVDQAQATLVAARQVETQIVGRDLPLARRTAADAHRLTEAGEGDRTTELAATAAAAEAELALLDARRAAAQATADLEDALRRPFDPAETETLKSALPGDRP